jgi:hypothetical protein
MHDDRFIQRLQDLKKKPRFKVTPGDSLIIESGRCVPLKKGGEGELGGLENSSSSDC